MLLKRHMRHVYSPLESPEPPAIINPSGAQVKERIMRNRSQKGFTLIELLIVIAIIGILAAVLIPNLLNARARAQDAGAQACASELLTQAEIFNIDNASYEDFDGTGDYAPNSCGDQVSGFTVDTADDTDVGGTVTSLSDQVFDWSNSTGIARAEE